MDIHLKCGNYIFKYVQTQTQTQKMQKLISSLQRAALSAAFPMFNSGLILLILISAAVASKAQGTESMVKLTEAVIATQTYTTMSLSGNTFVAGSEYGKDDEGTSGGAAYIMEKDSLGQWRYTTTIIASDNHTNKDFARTVYLFDGRLYIAHVGDEYINSEKGAVSVYEKNINGNWEEIQQISGDTLDRSERLGTSISASEDYLVIGCRDCDGDGANSGAAFVYKKDDLGLWSYMQRLFYTDGGNYDNFGMTVHIHEERILVGSRNHDSDSLNTGAAYIYELGQDNNWILSQKLEGPNIKHARFGTSVLAKDDFIYVGCQIASAETGEGAVYMYTQDSLGVWVEKQVISPPSAGTPSLFGYSFAIDSNQMVIGAPRDGSRGENAGAIYKYRQDEETGLWILKHKIFNENPTDFDFLGLYTGFSDGTIASIANQGGNSFYRNLYMSEILYDQSSPGCKSLNLHQNFPNPFNEKTTIGFDLLCPQDIQLNIMDQNGKIIKKIKVKGEAGLNEMVIDMTGYSGVFYYTIIAREMLVSKKMLVLD